MFVASPVTTFFITGELPSQLTNTMLKQQNTKIKNFFISFVILFIGAAKVLLFSDMRKFFVENFIFTISPSPELVDCFPYSFLSNWTSTSV